ncbi:hypothetical protein MYCTH_2112885 [Thermothelomyces thermophilus ATCC 42464]|uniref:Uncharacterized protein n=1 Tax=Thermothelomyces thermophilus (strain ATCC 42464 / BCRC 31852 / DSM 1799) TaxID=573729 RepID=G2QLQ3_THET4|nr:uncharacterized protein MYCTH_2112885 [Thermothelomyces thermophilus ATCC 42464]AEO60883.1 hypothetical protein MYCTH_2112885 [Thermothelomyces thermophilus ATCC 42464]
MHRHGTRAEWFFKKNVKCGDKPCAACRSNNAKRIWRDDSVASASSSSTLSSPSRSRTSSLPLVLAADTVASDFSSALNPAEESNTSVSPNPPPTAHGVEASTSNFLPSLAASSPTDPSTRKDGSAMRPKYLEINEKATFLTI